MGEWTIGGVVDAIADVIPDRTMTVCGERRTTYGEMAQRTRQFANFLAGRGFGAHRERDELDNWECGQDRVALIMYNDRYPELVVGCLKARTVPVNVNHHYTPREVAELLAYVKPRAVVYHKSLGAKFADVLPTPGCELLIAVDDGSDNASLPGSVELDDAVAEGDPERRIDCSPNDLIMYCTGGTTGRPKGVLWRQSDTYVSSMVGADHESATEIHDKVVGNTGAPWFAVSPLMHAAGLWTVFSGSLAGLPVVLYDDRSKFDPQSVWQTAEREKVGLMTMVGDAYAAPLIAELQRESYDLASLYAIGTGGAATNPKHVSALLEKLPQLTIINGYGSSETGNMGFGHNQRGSHRETFDLREGGTLVSEDMTRFVEPGRARSRVGGPQGAYSVGLLRRSGRDAEDVPRRRRAAGRGVRRPRVAGIRRDTAAVRAGLPGGQHRRGEGLRRRGRGCVARPGRRRRRAGGRPRQRALGPGDRGAGPTAPGY